MSFLNTVNWNTVEDIGFKPLPAGTYGAKITKAELSNNKTNTGKYVKLELTLVGSKGVKGRKIFDYLTIQHKNENVVRFSLAKLKKIMISIGLEPDEVKDFSELQNGMIGVTLKIENNEQYGPQNKVHSVSDFNEDLLTKGIDDEN